MGLQVWLPLTGNIENQGLANCTISGTPAYGTGKIGQALDLINSAAITISCSALNNKSQFSVCFWIKGTKDTSDGDWASPIRFTANKSGGTANSDFRFGKDNRADQTGYPISMFNNSNYPISTSNVGISTVDDWDKWIHVCFTTDGTSIKTYVNGVYKYGSSTGTGGWLTGTITLRAARYNGFLNDFRVYDQVLSVEEIKDLARGLVLHYPLDRNNLSPYTGNLILNAFGELGTKNWGTPAKVYTDDLPTGDATIKARFYQNTSQEYIPIYRGHTYNFSTWVKASQTTGSTYPSFIPYDIDKNRINYYNSKAGFNLNTMTTLKQQLKSGDTKIYVNDLSAWNAASGHHYNYAAIFYYTDGTGYRWPVGTYTRIVPAFGSSTNEKTNLDKTNNIITLNSAYSGITIPAGTSVCASTAGSTYFYPVGGVANSGIADWTQKTGNFSGDHNYLSAATYLRYYSYDNGYDAGMVLKDITLGESNLEYDTSGYQRNGTRNGNLTWDTDSSRYNISTCFNGTNTYIAAGTGAKVRDAITVNCWGYMDNWSTYAARMLSCTEGGGWNFEPSSSKMSFAVGTGESSNIYKNVTATSTLASLGSGWHMFTGTYDGFSSKIYIDGVLSNTNSAYTTKTPLFYNASNGIFVGAEAGGNTTTPAGSYFNGKMSDVRIYATALSAQDVKDLYNSLF